MLWLNLGQFLDFKFKFGDVSEFLLEDKVEPIDLIPQKLNFGFLAIEGLQIMFKFLDDELALLHISLEGLHISFVSKTFVLVKIQLSLLLIDVPLPELNEFFEPFNFWVQDGIFLLKLSYFCQ